MDKEYLNFLQQLKDLEGIEKQQENRSNVKIQAATEGIRKAAAYLGITVEDFVSVWKSRANTCEQFGMAARKLKKRRESK
jgi:hypothetical protein